MLIAESGTRSRKPENTGVVTSGVQTPLIINGEILSAR
jgi:hypothetical protein